MKHGVVVGSVEMLRYVCAEFIMVHGRNHLNQASLESCWNGGKLLLPSEIESSVMKYFICLFSGRKPRSSGVFPVHRFNLDTFII